MSGIDRREMLRRAGLAPLAGLVLSPAQAAAAHEHVARAKAAAAKAGTAGKPGAYAPKVFDAHEWATVRVLADMVIPKDARSGGATDAGVPEFVDAIAGDVLATPREREEVQTRLHGGLRWLDRESRARFGKAFVDGTDADRRGLLDAIAWPERAAAGLEAGVAFFSAFRDLVASGFWSSKVGFEDLGYQGNTFVAEWNGCPEEVVARIGTAPAKPR
ncbi:MAG: gluconate 2-dehydrogenase subunit 3 family protein [Vicinamibacteria bacterium]